MSAEDQLEAYIAGGGRLSAPDNASPRYRAELMRLMAGFADSEMAGAAGFADCINLAPGLRERIVAARIVAEKFGHAAKVLDVMAPFGVRNAAYVTAHAWAARLDRSVNLGQRRLQGDMRLNVFHYPIQGWVDAVVMNLLMGRATVVQLGDLARGSYQPLADVVAEVLPVETRHAEWGEKGLEDALSRGHDRIDAQASVNYWHPRVADTFGRAGSGSIESHRKFGLRRTPNATLLDQWRDDVAARLRKLGLTVA